MNDQPERSEDFHKRCANLMSAVPQAEVAQLRKDSERMDKLESFYANADSDSWHSFLLSAAEIGFRKALDAAMNQP